mgnify:CR=1 FL=1
MFYLVPGGGQIAIIVLVVVVLFVGGKKIPELMKGLGKGMKEFKGAANGDSDEKKASDSDDSGKTDDSKKSEA